MIYKCPGQDPRNIKAEKMKCANCGYELEIFSDEVKVKCPKCKNVTYKQRLPSCLDWCKAAKDCIGAVGYGSYVHNKELLLKDRLFKELEKYFGDDTGRIAHAKQVMEYSEELLRREGGDWSVVIPASIFHDVGIKAAEHKYGSAAGHLQEKEGPEIARRLLEPYGVKKDDIRQICQIIAHHHSPGALKNINFGIVCDADWLVNLKEEVDLKDKKKTEQFIEKVFVTETAREMARKLYL